MSKKVFKTIDQQVELLKDRGLIIEDDFKYQAEQFFLYNNYYRISGYTLTLRKNDKFYSNVNLNDVIQIYQFDAELRNILLKYLEIIEVKIKSIYSYEFAKLYGGSGYLDSNNFVNEAVFREIRDRINIQKERNIKYEAYIRHYENDVKEDMPLWVCVDLLSFSDISKLYYISTDELKKTVAVDFGLMMKDNTVLLGNYLRGLTILRNFCAHGKRLYNRLFERKPTLNSREKQLLISDENGVKDNSHLFGFIIEMKRLLSENEFRELKNELIVLKEKYPFVSMSYYGFRDDWEINI